MSAQISRSNGRPSVQCTLCALTNIGENYCNPNL